MTYDEVINHYGGIKDTAKALGLTDKAIYKWKGRPLSAKLQCWLELVSDGEITAHISARTPKEAKS